MFKRPPGCANCPLSNGPGEFVPPFCTCIPCTMKKEMGHKEGSRVCAAQLLIVGIAPGEEETRRGRPFVGPAGRVLSGALRWAKLERVPTKFMNLVQCRTMIQGRTKMINRDPTPDEIRYCVERFLGPVALSFKERAEQGENVVVLGLGSLAFRYLAGPDQGTFHESRGHRIELVVPTFKPAPQRKTHAKGPRVCKCGMALAPRRRKCDKCRKSRPSGT